MSAIRAFIAIEIDPSNKQRISTLITQLKKSNTDIKWITENQMHLTLKFLGNIDQVKIEKISNSLKSIANNFNLFTIRFSNIGTFPNIRRPRVIWLGIDKGSDSLKLLNNAIEGELEKIGIAKEKREFKPHLTLGRVKSLKGISDLTKLIDEANLQSQDEIKIDKLILFQSTLTPNGAIYKALAEHMLRLQ